MTAGFELLTDALDVVVASGQICTGLFQTSASVLVGNGPAVCDPAVAVFPVPPSAGRLWSLFAVVRDYIVVVAEVVEVNDRVTWCC